MGRICVLVLVCAACGDDGPARVPPAGSKLYIACQDDFAVQVVDGRTLAPLARIGLETPFFPHNVQVTPDRQAVWATSINLHPELGYPDEVVVIDPTRDVIVQRIALEAGVYPAHVVLSPDDKVAWVSAMYADKLYRIDATQHVVAGQIPLPPMSMPHGIRLSADGSRLYAAAMGGAVYEIDTATSTVLRSFPLSGPTMQVAVGAHDVFAAISDPPALSRIDLQSGAVTALAMPANTHGLAQDFVAPDGSAVYAAEQGDRNVPGTHLLAFDGATGALSHSWSVGAGAHGVTLSDDGVFAFVTSSYANRVTTIDVASGVVAQHATGGMPMGITYYLPPR